MAALISEIFGFIFLQRDDREMIHLAVSDNILFSHTWLWCLPQSLQGIHVGYLSGVQRHVWWTAWLEWLPYHLHRGDKGESSRSHRELFFHTFDRNAEFTTVCTNARSAYNKLQEFRLVLATHVMLLAVQSIQRVPLNTWKDYSTVN